MCSLSARWYNGQWLAEVTRITTSILQMSKLEFLEVKLLAQGHSARKDSVYLASKPALFQTHAHATFSTSLFKPPWFFILGHVLLEVFFDHLERWDSPRNGTTHSPPVLCQLQSQLPQKAPFYLPWAVPEHIIPGILTVYKVCARNKL